MCPPPLTGPWSGKGKFKCVNVEGDEWTSKTGIVAESPGMRHPAGGRVRGRRVELGGRSVASVGNKLVCCSSRQSRRPYASGGRHDRHHVGAEGGGRGSKEAIGQRTGRSADVRVHIYAAASAARAAFRRLVASRPRPPAVALGCGLCLALVASFDVAARSFRYSGLGAHEGGSRKVRLSDCVGCEERCREACTS